MAVAGLAAGMPSMLTRPAPINSAACWRERASPRRTSSASTRARRVTADSALLDRFQRAHQQVVGLLEPRAMASMSDFGHRRPSRRSSAGSGTSASNCDDLGADLIGVGTHLAVHASRLAPRQQGPAVAWPVGPCRLRRDTTRRHRRRRRPRPRWRWHAPPTARSAGSSPVDVTVTAAVADVDVPRRDAAATRKLSASLVQRRGGLRRCSSGRCSDRGAHGVGGGADPAQHHQAGQARGVGAGDVGVEAVADHQRRVKLPRANASVNSVGAGLPATCGSASVAVRSAATIEPFPGSSPRSDGSVLSTLAATHSAPARMASAASARSDQPVSGE